MKVRFFIYDKETGRLNLILSEMPENDFIEECKIVFNNKVYMEGIKWDNIDWEYLEEAIELSDVPERYLYNEKNKEIIEDKNWEWIL